MIHIDQLRVMKNGRTICSVVELQIALGERVACVGPNGSGKTTFLRVLSGLETNYDGDCRIEARGKDCVYVHQNPYLFRGTVLSNVVYGLLQRGEGRAASNRAAQPWLQQFGLSEIADQRINHVSGGERRRVALARAMILQPKLLLLDEPLADLDRKGLDAVSAAIDQLDHCTIVIASPTELPSGLASRTHTLDAP